MSPSCPISQRRIDSNLVRIVSFWVLLFTLLFAVTQMLPFLMIVLFDFIARVLRQETFSPFRQMARFILSLWDVKPRYTNEAPKRFALFLGLGMTLVITLLALLGFVKTAVFVSVVLMICAFLEVLFDFCIGCKLYYALELIKVMRHDRNFN
ncbi:MAG: DUF4395 domain-containing protein [Sulfurovum sp.]|nr:DUF4395 domain-containing protein [Sulfurovum sp.]